eukprot:550724-Pyramimonas_sp.AAC.1
MYVPLSYDLVGGWQKGGRSVKAILCRSGERHSHTQEHERQLSSHLGPVYTGRPIDGIAKTSMRISQYA